MSFFKDLTPGAYFVQKDCCSDKSSGAAVWRKKDRYSAECIKIQDDKVIIDHHLQSVFFLEHEEIIALMLLP